MAQNTPPPIPTQSPMLTNDGLVTRVWIAWFTYLKGIFGYNQTIQNNGTVLPQELSINFSDQFIVTDNATNGSTDVSLAPIASPYQLGQSIVPSTGGAETTFAVVFPLSYAVGVTPKVFVNPTSTPRSSPDPLSCYATNITNAGFIINLACGVPTGGGGATLDNNIPVDWLAIT